jgi:hypothetical protein
MTKDVTSALSAFHDEYRAMQELGKGVLDEGLVEANEVRNHLFRLGSAFQKLKQADRNQLPKQATVLMDKAEQIETALDHLNTIANGLEADDVLNTKDQMATFASAVHRLEEVLE